jgi:cytochrome P450
MNPDPARRKRPPGPTGQISLSSENGDDVPQFEMLRRLHEKYGDAFGYSTIAGSLYVFVHPDDVKSVFQRLEITRTPLLGLALGEGVLAADNDHWRRQRKLMLPAFRRPNVAGFAALMAATAEEHVDIWLARPSGQFDVVEAMSKLTFSIVARSLFSIDLTAEMDGFLRAYSFTIEYLAGIANATSFNSRMTLSPTRNAEFRAALEQMNEVVYSVIERRRGAAQAPDDLLTLLMEALDADSGQPLTDVQIRDEVITMLLAGHETTSLTLTWAWYLLARHPAAAERLRHEIEAAIGTRTVTEQDLRAIPYSRMVLEESLRLYPPVAAIYRQNDVEIEIGGYTVPEHSGLVVCPYLTHRHAAFWPNPLAFMPERFSSAAAANRHSYCYVPFGAGRHLCLGKHFALLEGQIILITLMQRCQLRLPESEAPEPHLTLTLRPKHGLFGLIERAEGWVGR